MIKFESVLQALSKSKVYIVPVDRNKKTLMKIYTYTVSFAKIDWNADPLRCLWCHHFSSSGAAHAMDVRSLDGVRKV